MGDTPASGGERIIGASPEAIYRACTDPVALATWRVPHEMTGKVHNFDLRAGGGYTMSLYYPASESAAVGKTAAGEDRYTARFIALEPPRRIVEAIIFDADDPAFGGEMVMETTLAPVSGGTRVVIGYAGLPHGVRPEDNAEGTRSSLEKLARYVEGGMARP